MVKTFSAGLAVILVLCGCAGRQVEPVTVHVFSNQPAHADVTGISEALGEAGFLHRINYRETPGGLEIGETVLVHPDDSAGFNDGQQVAAIVARHLGQEPVIKSPGHRNHNFTRGNLGLYVHLPRGDRMARPERVAWHFAGSCGEYSISMELMDSGRFRYQLERWDADRLEHNHLAFHEGRWFSADDSLRLETADGTVWTGRKQPGYGDRDLLVLDAPDEAAGCHLQQPL